MLKPSATPLVRAMADALPTHQKDDMTSDLSSTLDVLALFAHGSMVSHGFRLIGFSEDQNLPECERLAPRLPPQWNDNINSRSFVYAHDQSSMRFIVKIDRLGSKIEIRGLAVGDERINRFDFVPRDYVTATALPLRISKKDNGEEDRSDLEDKIKAVFPEPRLQALAELFNTNIVEKFFPSSSDGGESIRTRPQQPPPPNPQDPGPLPEPARPNPYPFNDPLSNIPRAPARPAGDFPPPGFEDEYEINRPPRGGGLAVGGRNPAPFNIGHDDLNPPGLGPHDPLRASFIPGGGLPRPGGRGGGMHPTFDDPLFGGPHGGDDDDGLGGYGPNAPPGARWDPIGPGGMPRFGGGGRGRGNDPFGGGGGFGFGGGFSG
jgi:hypothetical protein